MQKCVVSILRFRLWLRADVSEGYSEGPLLTQLGHSGRPALRNEPTASVRAIRNWWSASCRSGWKRTRRLRGRRGIGSCDQESQALAGTSPVCHDGVFLIGGMPWTGSRSTRTRLRRLRRQFRRPMCLPSNSRKGSHRPSPRTEVDPTRRWTETATREQPRRRRRCQCKSE